MISLLYRWQQHISNRSVVLHTGYSWKATLIKSEFHIMNFSSHLSSFTRKTGERASYKAACFTGAKRTQEAYFAVQLFAVLQICQQYYAFCKYQITHLQSLCTVNLLNITPKFFMVSTFVIVNLEILYTRIQYTHTFMVYLHAHFHMYSASASFLPKQSNFGRFVMQFYIVETVPLKELRAFKNQLPYIISGPFAISCLPYNFLVCHIFSTKHRNLNSTGLGWLQMMQHSPQIL